MSTDATKRDFCDGEFFHSHPIFSVHRNALQFVLYYDDIEVANPLGSRAGNHKLGTKYLHLYVHYVIYKFTIRMFLLYTGKYKTSIQIHSSINLAIAKSSLLREFTADAILEKFVVQMNMLSKV